MQLPDECQAWVEQMEQGSEDDRRILENLREDPCIPDEHETAARFCSLLTRTGRLTNSREARTIAENIVRDNPDWFLCLGDVVPDSRFRRVLRIEHLDALWRWLPFSDRRKVGLRRDVGDLTDEDVEAVLEECRGQALLGNQMGVVWTTDLDEVERLLGDLASVADRLGMKVEESPTRRLVCVYNRRAMRQRLHVPRALDAMDHPGFEPNPDCAAATGRTRPTTRPAEEGVPEAVHRSCTVTLVQCELRTIL